jgi:MerR, DNA binding
MTTTETADVARLYRISLLRRLGFPLEQVMSVLDDPQWELAAAVSRHLEETRRRAASAARLGAQLAGMAAELVRQDIPSAEQLLQEYVVRVFGLTAAPAAGHTEGVNVRSLLLFRQRLHVHVVPPGGGRVRRRPGRRRRDRHHRPPAPSAFPDRRGRLIMLVLTCSARNA